MIKSLIIALFLFMSTTAFVQEKASVDFFTSNTLSYEQVEELVQSKYGENSVEAEKKLLIIQRKMSAGYFFIAKENYPKLRTMFQQFLVQDSAEGSNLHLREDWQYLLILEEYF